MSDTTCQIRRCDASDTPQIAQLLDTVFQIKNPAKEALIRWKYFAPAHRHQTVMYAGVNAAGEFVSQYANIPVTLRYGAAPLVGMICADMATLPDYRGRGLISTLARHVYPDVVRDGAALSLGFSNQEGIKVDQNADGYGYRIVGQFHRYAMLNLPFAKTPYRLQEVRDFEDVSLFSLSCLFRIEKSCEYLNWRYREKPANDYHIYQITKGQSLVGYLVTREMPTHAYIYDVIADDAELPAIIPAIRQLLWRRGKLISVWYVLDNSYWQQTLQGCLAISSTWRQTNYYLTVKAHSDTLSSLPMLYQTDCWWMMAGDIL